MTDTCPITPPPELAQQWREQLFSHLSPAATVAVHELSRIAAQWGADQELEACCEAIKNRMWFAQPTFRLAELRAARRPKSSSLKKQALIVLEDASLDAAHENIIRRALESLPD